jgi:hypothetical protein
MLFLEPGVDIAEAAHEPPLRVALRGSNASGIFLVDKVFFLWGRTCPATAEGYGPFGFVGISHCRALPWLLERELLRQQIDDERRD